MSAYELLMIWFAITPIPEFELYFCVVDSFYC